MYKRQAIGCDPRIKLFGDFDFDYADVEPLFLPTDYIIFDKYSDGDNFTDENYISNFRLILDAIKNKHPLRIETLNRKGNLVGQVVLPEYLEYSEKDDKFRLILSLIHIYNVCNRMCNSLYSRRNFSR